MIFNDVMVDIETSGTSVDHAGIIQIAAVKFDYATSAVSEDVFNYCLRLPPNRFWDEGTREWWGRQKAHILAEIKAQGQDPHAVTKAFYDWLLKDYPQTPGGLRFWSKPLSFDFALVASYFKQYGYDNPCHFRYARDLNSYIAGLNGSPEHIDIEKQIEFEGDAHNAIADVVHQIKVLFAAKSRFIKAEVVA